MTRTALLLCTASALGLAALCADPVRAQEAAPQPEPPPAEPGAPAEAERVTVTGSRIVTPGLTSPNPITSVTGGSIQYSGDVSVVESLENLPSLIGSTDAQSVTGQGLVGVEGLQTLNLRNLGDSRTLVLVNGRRHVGSLPGDASVDVNTIPIDLLDRVDILTGGASAVYGADGVSGVVNFVLRRDLDRAIVRLQGGVAEEGDAGQVYASAAAGLPLLDDRGTVIVALEQRYTDGINRSDREFTSNRGFSSLISNPAEGVVDDPLIPDRIYARDVRYNDSAGASFVFGDVYVAELFGGGDPAAIPGSAFIGTGDPWDPGIQAGARQIGGNTTNVAEYTRSLTPEQRVTVGNIAGTYELTPQVRLFFEGKAARNRSFSRFQPSFDFFLPVQVDNPFIPSGILTNLTPLAAGDCQGIFGATGALDCYLINRDNFDLGFRGSRSTRTTWRGVAGFEGDLTDWLAYEVSYVYGRTDVDTIDTNNRLTDRWLAAIDVVFDPVSGRNVCRSDLDPASLPVTAQSFTPGPGSGCVPINVFDENGASPAAQAWVLQNTPTDGALTQQVVTAFVQGDSSAFFETWSGPVSFAIGAEWRREESEDFPDPIYATGNTFGNVLIPTVGSFEVAEAFAEVEIPLLRDLPFVYDLTLEGAVRSSRYTTTGSSNTYSWGGSYAPVEGLTLRGTSARAVRAPNVGELFTPQQQSFFLPDDPCDDDNVTLNPERLANCTAELAGFGLVAGVADLELSASFPGLQQGNPNLQEETADTITFGVVLQPLFLPGFAATIDYYQVEIAQGIILPDEQDIVNACYDAPSLVNQFCALLTRQAGGPNNGQLASLTVQAVNFASFETSGIDFGVTYRFDVADAFGSAEDYGALAIAVTGGWLESLDLAATLDGTIDDEAGELNTLLGRLAPEWILNTALTWTFGDWTVGYTWAWHDEVLRLEQDDLAANPDAQDITGVSARSEHDVVVRYQATDVVEVYAGVNNLTGEEPDIGFSNTPVGAIGRFFYGGVTLSFDTGSGG